MSLDERHKVHFSGEDRHEYGVWFLVHKDIVSAVLGCRPVSSRLISISLRAAPLNVTIIHLNTMTVRSITFISNSWKLYTKYLRRMFLLYKGFGMLRLEGMRRQTGERCVDPTVKLRQIREVSDSYNLQPVTTYYCHIPWGHTSSPEGGHGTAQTESIITRLTTSW